ncbi:cardiolipin synthase [Anaerobranca californiensis DSM 14826]|uniref:Cardiolipin synthase n=1 Tax=Anaerobranca californiensis DSM 14826 TaxID=1120989 RepID=A0A1M6MPZ4_9FIRM|nr:cardiolipin synthase [Anaerobranca californiensis]SHJ85499.1 cardiolipin synthase [Anaerobranca californiensis DSM 14826]
MNLFYLTFSIISVLNLIFAITLIFLERRDPTATWAWVLILTLLPGIGFIIYLFFGLRFRKRKIYREKQIKDFRFPHDFSSTINRILFQIHTPYIRRMVRLGYKSHPSSFVGYNEVEIFVRGEDKFNSLFQDIEKAQCHIHINYYIIKNDHLGRKLLELLTQKAYEGVEVRVLYDGMGCRKLPRNFFAPLFKAGGKAVKFSPSFLDINYRNHRKIVVIDGKVGYIGGFNVGKEYLGQKEEFGFWRDTHLRLVGESVDTLQYRFLLDWNFASGEEVDYYQRYFPKKENLGEVKVQIVTSGPDSREEEIKYLFLKMIYGAKKSIYIQTPYFIPDQTMLEALKIATMSGVDVRIVVPDKPDHPFVYEANHSYLGLMLESGARCYHYKGGFLHSKTIVVDGEVASVGTTNMDVRSFKLNFEINAFIYDTKTASELKGIFLADLEICEEITLEKYNQRSIGMKFKESIARLVSPIL